MYDIVIIGAGVVGCSVARELAKYKLKTCVVEKRMDVATGTTKANSAIVHAGHDANPGTLKAKLNVKGNAMFDKLSEELEFPFKRNGTLVLCFDKNDIEKLEQLKDKGHQNGVLGLEILNREQVLEKEPNLSDHVVAALNVPTGAIVCPYEMTIALAENAYINGTEFKFNTKVEGIKKIEKSYTIVTNQGEIKTKLIINAAGVYSAEINNMVSENKITIIPRKGEYCVFDKMVGAMVKSTLFQLPTIMGKGVLVTPSVDGNLLIGPNAMDVDSNEDLSTTQKGMDEILEKAALSIKRVPVRQIIGSFAGLRAHIAHTDNDDFIIGEVEDAENFINAVGIESPGLSSAPAIAEMIEDIVIGKLNPKKNDNYNPRRIGVPRFREMDNEAKRALITQDSAYGRVICRCETVTEGEIVNAIHRPLGARTLDGVKRRTRAGMGRCQSGFCSTKIVEILARELNVPITEITKFGGNSNILVGKNKEI